MKFLFLLLAGLMPMSSMANNNQEWRFRVFLEEREIGTHVFRIQDKQGKLRVESDADYAVNILFIEAYRYSHRAREQWQNNCLTAIETTTDDNGEFVKVSGLRNDIGFNLISSSGASKLPFCTMTFAYWNPAILKQTQLLNAQTGELIDIRVEPLGEETLIIKGKPEVTHRYALHAPTFRVDLWYQTDYHWVQLESQTEAGRVLRYITQ